MGRRLAAIQGVLPSQRDHLKELCLRRRAIFYYIIEGINEVLKAYRTSQEPSVLKLKEPALDEITHALVGRYNLNFTRQDISSLWFLCKQEASLLNITDQACALFTPSEVFNIPLLSVAASFVAEDISKNASKGSTSDERTALPSVPTALLLALGIGLCEALAMYLGAGLFLNMMGISTASPMHIPAQQFLELRAIGAPAVVLSLAIQGIFRGFKDTKTPVLRLGWRTRKLWNQRRIPLTGLLLTSCSVRWIRVE